MGSETRQDGDNITQLRLQLFRNGWSPIPNRDKRTFTKGWPSLEIDEDLIRQWGRRNKRDTATGLRIENGLAAIDIDVNIPAVFDAVSRAIEETCPAAYEQGLIRRGKGVKEAWFVRTSEVFSRIHTRRWRARGAGPDDETHCLEIFGGASPRQFGAFGPHTVGDDGKVLVAYRWDETGGDPSTVCQSELPVLTKAQFHAIADAAERALEAAGLEPVPRSTRGENDATRLYDLAQDMQFDCDDGVRRSLDDLRAHLGAVDHVRCSASWLEGEQAKRPDRCIAGLDRSGGVTVWESASGVTHCEADRKPRDFQLELDRVAEKLKQLEVAERNRLSTRDSAVVTAAKLLETYALCPEQPQRCVVPLWSGSMDAGMNMSMFRTLMAPYADEEVGPKGGRVVINPVDIWNGASKRVAVAGLRMRPDKPRPTYEDRGELWVNTYDPPVHDGAGGDASIGWEFMEQLLPDEREREWFMRWLAYKFRHPSVPGPAVVMVARKQGTGRGTLAQLMKKLFGPKYVATLPFHIFAGKSYQSQYNDWAAEALVAVINESSEIGGGAYAAKHNTYEHLKETVEPRMEERLIVRKGDRSFMAVSFTSYIIATNNPDALPIPPEDRRFAVLSNGEPREPEFWEAVNAWMGEPANVASFAAELRALDLGDYSPNAAPLRTEAKDAMTELGRSDLDRAFDMAMENLPADVYVAGQVINLMRAAMHEFEYEFPQSWQAMAKRMITKGGHRVGVKDGINWHPMIEGKRHPVYAKTAAAARLWQASDRLREEVLKNGKPDANSASNVLTGLFKK